MVGPLPRLASAHGSVAALSCRRLAGVGGAYCSGRAVFHRPEGVEATPPLTAFESSLQQPPLQAEAGPPTSMLWVALPLGLTPLSAPQLFRGLAADGYASLSEARPEQLLEAAARGGGDDAAAASVDRISRCLVNDLQASALAGSPELAAVHQALLDQDGVSAAALSGAGPALFAFGSLRGATDDDGGFARRLEEQHASVGLRVVAAPLVRREGEEAWYEEPVP